MRHHGYTRDGEPVIKLPEYLLELCRQLRQAETPPEQALWRCLRDRQLLGCKFRRQHAIGRYIADFYCHEAGLVVELDGGVHQEEGQAEYDDLRTAELKVPGLTVLRFWNYQIHSDLAGVLQRIGEVLEDGKSPDQISSPPAPLPRGEGSPDLW
ncbi:MAG: endonuclease domain-containing protein [Armatimonadota bacterium]